MPSLAPAMVLKDRMERTVSVERFHTEITSGLVNKPQRYVPLEEVYNLFMSLATCIDHHVSSAAWNDIL